MAKCELTIQLEDEQEVYRAGDVVRGHVEVRTDEDVTCNGLTLSSRWLTRGRGNRAYEEHDTVTVFEGLWRAGAIERYPFSLTLPAGPYTYDGHYLNVAWEIQARADIPWAFDPKAEKEIALAPAEDTEPDWLAAVATPTRISEDLRNLAEGKPEDHKPPDTRGPMGKLVGNTLGLGCLVLLVGPFLGAIWMGAIRALAVYRGEIEWSDGIGWMIGGGVCTVLVCVALFFGLRNLVAQKKLGKVIFEVDPRLIRAGEELRVKVYCQPQTESELRKATAHLKAEEKVVRGSGTNRKTYTHTVFEQETEISVQRTLAKGLPFQADRTIALPADAPPSFLANDNRLTWTLTLHMDIARWPDWVDSKELLVHP